MIAYYNWYNTFFVTNQLVSQKMFSKQPLYWDDVEKIQAFLMKITSETIKGIEDNCDFKDLVNIGSLSEKPKEK